MRFSGVKCRPPLVTLPRHNGNHEVIRLRGKVRRTVTGSPVGVCARAALKLPKEADPHKAPRPPWNYGTDISTCIRMIETGEL